VDVNSTAPTTPYTNWATAARVIQDAIEASTAGDVVLVTNGVYRDGGRVVTGVTNVYVGPGAAGGAFVVPGDFTNRVAVTKAIIVRSVNGPAWTTIEGSSDGGQASRCVFLTNEAVLSGFTLSNGYVNNGGGVWCLSTNARLSNCIVISNKATFAGGVFSGTVERCLIRGNHAVYGGGGAAASTLNDSILTGNLAAGGGGGSGGGAYFCLLNNSTVVSNTASAGGGGTAESTLNNCIAYYNIAGFAPLGHNHDYRSVLSYCCTTPQPTNGVGNITNAPLFVDLAVGDLRLQSTSPCINAGHNAFVTGTTDLDDNPRIAGGTVDIGAYEFQSPASTLSYTWLQQFNLPTDGSADYVDSDSDGHNNWQEWRADTVPTNAVSRLILLTPTNTPDGVAVTWQSAATRSYFLERGTKLAEAPSLLPLATNLLGQPGTRTFTDATATNGGPYFYRVGVQ
jgi:hypothetical protein